jgi:choline dehydrogenase-like flavoprotein
MNVVIGSGPAAVAAATALLAERQPVTMVDPGSRLEPDVEAKAARLGDRLPESWTAAERDSIKGPLRYNAEGAPLKLAFGSDYVYRDVDALQPVIARGVDAYRSLATGGMSAIWGAAVLPYADADFDGWPITPAEMRPYYAAALNVTGLAAERDALARIYPLHIEPTTHVALSSQARHVWNRMTAHAGELSLQHVHFGHARLAIQQPTVATVTSCAQCGMCLYGCPYGLIYSAQTTLERSLIGQAGFTYERGLVVRRLIERSGGVTIDAISRDDNTPRRIEAARVYLAAGAIGSTAILLNSLQAHGRSVLMRQSDHFLLPLVSSEPAYGAPSERLHTLSQLFIELLDSSISEHAVHLQLYTYNDLYARMAEDRLGVAYPLAAPLVARLIARLLMIKGYLHSNESAAIRASLAPRGDVPALHLEAKGGTRSDAIIRAVGKVLMRNRRRIGATPIRLALRKGLPGSGVHIGGSFPMREHPREFESDTLGRPTGFSRVHVVDATVFPTVAAASTTLTIMANAWRIASSSARGEAPACS